GLTTSSATSSVSSSSSSPLCPGGGGGGGGGEPVSGPTVVGLGPTGGSHGTRGVGPEGLTRRYRTRGPERVEGLTFQGGPPGGQHPPSTANAPETPDRNTVPWTPALGRGEGVSSSSVLCGVGVSSSTPALGRGEGVSSSSVLCGVGVSSSSVLCGVGVSSFSSVLCGVGFSSSFVLCRVGFSSSSSSSSSYVLCGLGFSSSSYVLCGVVGFSSSSSVLCGLRVVVGVSGVVVGVSGSMVGERRNGNLLVQLGPRLQAFPEELLRQRHTHQGHTEYLVRWALVTLDDGSASGSGAGGGAGGASGDGADGSSGGVAGGGGMGGVSGSAEGKTESILMWMSMEDVCASCPSLLGKRKADGPAHHHHHHHHQRSPPQQQQQQEEEEHEEEEEGRFPGGGGVGGVGTFDEVELSDMKGDVVNLVRRARKQMTRGSSDFSISVTHTVHVLSAYAGIGALVGVFRETGALDLLMELLCNRESQTRRSAGKMLRALASHDAGQQDGIEQRTWTWDKPLHAAWRAVRRGRTFLRGARHLLLRGAVHLPHGKLLFSLVKRYLCVTSLMDKLNTAGVESSSDRQEAGPSSASSPGSSLPTEYPRLQRQFDFSMAMANLISELVRVMGWDRPRPSPDGSTIGGGAQAGSGGDEEQGEELPRPILRSIFQPRFSSIAVSGPTPATPTAATATVATAVATTSAVAAAPPKKKSEFKSRSNFGSRSAYVDYVQANLTSGMQVRMLQDYDEVSAGDEGEFRYSNDGSPPVQVYWSSLSRTYWVHWHMVEILGEGPTGSAEKEGPPEASSALTEALKLTAVRQTFLSKPPGGLYSLPYMSEEPQVEEQACLTRAEWWEVLFFIRKLEPKQQIEANRIIQQCLGVQLDIDEAVELEYDEAPLVDLTPPAGVAKKLLHFLNQNLAGSCLPDLLSSHTFAKLRRAGLSSSSSSSSILASVSKKPKKEERGEEEEEEEEDLRCSSPDTESELPSEEEARGSEDVDEKMKGR
ncbi:hypothetical protein CRUP_026945, partial [Coryphaenoides rupestris]